MEPRFRSQLFCRDDASHKHLLPHAEVLLHAMVMMTMTDTGADMAAVEAVEVAQAHTDNHL